MRRGALSSLYRWRPRVADNELKVCELSGYCCSVLFSVLQMGESVGESGLCKMDLEHALGIVGIVATVLNLLVVVFVYIFTPV